MFLGLRYIAAVGGVQDIGIISRLIDEEFAIAKAKYGPRHFDIIVLEGSRGDTISDGDLLSALRHLNRTGSRYQAVQRQVTPQE